VSEIAWISTNAMQRSHAAGELRGNALGFHDMSGNVWEWVADFHGASYYAVSPDVDPTGPTTGGCRVIRGGAWYYQSWNARSSNRGCDAPQTATTYIGFRVARTP
jgi:formylglycine-generating enzyme required for sulfatase activity